MNSVFCKQSSSVSGVGTVLHVITNFSGIFVLGQTPPQGKTKDY